MLFIFIVALIVLASPSSAINLNCYNKSADNIPKAIYLTKNSNDYHVLIRNELLTARLTNNLAIITDQKISPFQTNPNGAFELDKQTWVFSPSSVCIYAEKKEKNCSQVEKLFNGNLNSVAILAAVATDDPSAQFVLVVKRDRSNPVVRQIVYDSNRHLVFESTFKTDSTVSGLTFLGRDGDIYKFLVFYGSFYANYAMKKDDLRKPIAADLNQEWHTSYHWTGCPPDICFDGKVDAAASMENNSLWLARGDWTWRTDIKESPKAVKSEVNGASDAAFSYKNRLFVINENSVYILSNGDKNIKPLEDVFDGRRERVDAAFQITRKQIALINGNRFSVYDSVSDGKWRIAPRSTSLISRTWQGLPATIDAAASRLQKEIIFFHGNFFFRAPITGGRADAPQLIQNTFFQCSDEHYRLVGFPIGLVTYNKFSTYRNRFQPQLVDDSEPTREPRPRIPEEITPEPQPQSVDSGIAMKVLIAFVSIVLLLASVTLILFFVERRRRPDPDYANRADWTAGTSVVTTESVIRKSKSNVSL